MDTVEYSEEVFLLQYKVILLQRIYKFLSSFL